MFNKYFIVYREDTNLDHDLYVKTRPVVPPPILNYDEIEVPGREGKLYRQKGYGDIDISIEFNFMSKDPSEWNNKIREIKTWLQGNGNKILKLSDDLDVFYIVNKVTIETPERIFKRIGSFKAIFTCNPYTYLVTGMDEIDLPNMLINEYVTSRPIYKIYGEGLCSININGKMIKVNVSNNLTIDTNLGLCFRHDGGISNSSLAGKYEDMYLVNGENTFTISNGFSIKIVPNWRCI